MNRRVVTYVAVAVLIGLLVGVAVGWFVKPAEVVTAQGLSGTIKIGWIDCLSGSGAFWGEELLAAGQVALEEVNEYLKAVGAGWQLELVVEDSELKPDVALQKLQALYAQGITIVTGIGFSADLKAMMTYANTNHILLLAGGNSHELAVPGDFVFRVLPTGITMGKCIAALLRELGIKYFIYVWRGDAYGDSLAKATRDWCAKLGITMDEGIRYDPNAVEFSAEASILNTKVQQAVASYGADKVAWGILCFEEGKAFFKALEQYNPVSWGIKMVESGGMCLTDWALEPSIADVNYRGNYTHSDFRPSVSARTEEVQKKIKAKIGREADIYGLIGYDEVWILALALQAAGKYDADAVKAQLPYIFYNYMSIIGWAPLDENGDKSAVTFGVYRILKVDNAYKWAQIGTYDPTVDKVSWLPEPVIIG